MRKTKNAGMPAGSLEQLQATRYATAQQYKSHHDDDFDAGSTGHQRRLKTIFAYLQADGNLPTGDCGGATRFDRLHQQNGKPLRVYPTAGRALMWNNWADDGERDAAPALDAAPTPSPPRAASSATSGESTSAARTRRR